MRLAIIVPVTRPQALRACLGRLVEQTYNHSDFEIILVKANNCQIDLPQADISIKCVEENNLHASVRRNIAVKNTTAPFLAFFDDDVVPTAHWVEESIRKIDGLCCDGVCGPILHYDNDSSFPFKLSGAVNDSFFLEGFKDAQKDKIKKVLFYNMPLCNCLIKRSVWDAVGGFNETASYYIDDIEFFYIATQLGFVFYVVPELSVKHRVEAFPFQFFKKKAVTRFYTGFNSVLFNEIYFQLPFIKIGLFFYVFLTGLVYSMFYSLMYLKIILVFYLVLAIIFSLRFIRDKWTVGVFLPAVFFITHGVIFISFTAGVLCGLLTYKKHKPVILEKNKRLTFSNL